MNFNLQSLGIVSSFESQFVQGDFSGIQALLQSLNLSGCQRRRANHQPSQETNDAILWCLDQAKYYPKELQTRHRQVS